MKLKVGISNKKKETKKQYITIIALCHMVTYPQLITWYWVLILSHGNEYSTVALLGWVQGLRFLYLSSPVETYKCLQGVFNGS